MSLIRSVRLQLVLALATCRVVLFLVVAVAHLHTELHLSISHRLSISHKNMGSTKILTFMLSIQVLNAAKVK